MNKWSVWFLKYYSVLKMIVKYVRQFPKTANKNKILEKQVEQRILENLDIIPLMLKEKSQNDYFYPLAIEITQRCGMVEYENFLSKVKN